jgi:hypothetical protein
VPLFLISALGREWSDFSVPVGLEAGWASEPVRTVQRRDRFLACARKQTPAVYAAARRYTDWAIPAQFS